MSTVSEVVDAICKSLRERPEEWKAMIHVPSLKTFYQRNNVKLVPLYLDDGTVSMTIDADTPSGFHALHFSGDYADAIDRAIRDLDKGDHFAISKSATCTAILEALK